MQRSPTILPTCTASTCLSPIWPMRIEDRGLKRHIWRETRCCLAHICMPVEWNRDSTARGETSLANSSSPFDQPSRGFRCVFYTVPVPNDLHRDQLQKRTCLNHSTLPNPLPGLSRKGLDYFCLSISRTTIPTPMFFLKRGTSYHFSQATIPAWSPGSRCI